MDNCAQEKAEDEKNGLDVEIRPFGVFSEGEIVLCKNRAFKPTATDTVRAGPAGSRAALDAEPLGAWSRPVQGCVPESAEPNR